MRYLFIVSLMFLTSCEYLQPKEKQSDKTIASVGDIVLTEKNLDGLIPDNLSVPDSTIFVEKFIEDWIIKQLMIGKANEEINLNEAAIQQKVLNYQYALIVHELEKKFIDENLETDVSDEEIQSYYEKKSENFILRQNLAQCIYYKIPLSSPNINRFKRHIKNYPADSVELKDYANQFAITAFAEDSLWIRFDEIIAEIPLKEIENEVEFLKRNSLVEVSDNEFTYFLRIFKHRLVGEIAPLEFVRGNVSDIIINKRKIELKMELEKKIYEEAEESNAFKTYPN